MFDKDHLIVGAVGFVLGGVVATASITAVLMTQSHDDNVCPPAIVAPAPQVSVTPTPEPVATTAPDAASPTPTPPPVAPVAPAPVKVAPAPVKPAPVPAPVVTAKVEPPKPAPAHVKPKLAPRIDPSLEAEEADRLTEEQKELLARKQSLKSQLDDSAEIIRLKEQQIREIEAKLKQPAGKP